MRWLTVLGALLAVPAMALAHGFRDDEPMNELRVSVAGAHVHATQGSTCMIRAGGPGLCRDTSGDLPVEGRLHLGVGEPVRFRLDHPATRLAAALHATDGRGPRERLQRLDPEPVGSAPATEWEARVRPGLPAADLRLVVQVTYDPAADPTGDSAFQAAVRAPGRDPAPRTAVAAARRRAESRLGEGVRVTFSLRSERRPRWALVTGRRGRQLWAAWVRRGEDRRWRVERFRTRRFDPRGVPCDIAPAYSEPRC